MARRAGQLTLESCARATQLNEARGGTLLQTLKLHNFRCFENHKIAFRQLNVLVGHNNAGKSTIAEALRIISIVAERFRNISSYRDPPSWLPVPRRLRGCAISLENLEINFESMFHRYGEPPAMIEADFGRVGRLRTYVAGERRVHCVVYDGSGAIVTSRDRARKLKLPPVCTLPQVGPVAPQETILTSGYVRGSLSSRLAPIHLRNQLNLLYDRFGAFQENVEATWKGLQVQELIGQGGPPGEPLHLEIRDGDFVAEVALMGHGLQMWLQTIWFLTRVSPASTIILDEPDVYMHSDLQRKLIRHVRTQFPQVIITTHSTEIMAEVSPENIIVIDKRREESAAADSLPAVQRVIESLGSATNVHLARLWVAKRFLLVEGKDRRLLKAFQDVLFPKSAQPMDALPSAELGGWGGWRYGLGTSLVLQNAGGNEIVSYCILDSDYHSTRQIQDLEAAFRQRGVQLHVWARKEIENYVLVPTAIERIIAERLPARLTVPPSLAEIVAYLEGRAQSMRDDCLDGMAQEWLSVERGLGAGGANKEARAQLDAKVAAVGWLGCVSGKGLLAALFEWAKAQWRFP